MNPKLTKKKLFEKEAFFYNHVTDQRNLQLAKRLVRLPKLLDKQELENGKYVMVTFGLAHTVGASYYLKHPRFREVKDMLYSLTYNLVDANSIVKYVPTKEGWEKTILN